MVNEKQIIVKEIFPQFGVCTLVIYEDTEYGFSHAKVIPGGYDGPLNEPVPMPLINGLTWAEHDRAVIERYLENSVSVAVAHGRDFTDRILRVCVRNRLMPGQIIDAVSVYMIDPANEDAAESLFMKLESSDTENDDMKEDGDV